MRRLLCAVFGHALPPGVRREMSICFHCARCRAVVPGEFLSRRRQRGDSRAVLVRREALYLAVKGTKK